MSSSFNVLSSTWLSLPSLRIIASFEFNFLREAIASSIPIMLFSSKKCPKTRIIGITVATIKSFCIMAASIAKLTSCSVMNFDSLLNNPINPLQNTGMATIIEAIANIT